MAHVDLFISDLHFSHSNIIKFERTRFESIQHHDNFLVEKHTHWYNKIIDLQKHHHDVTFYNLGDFGNLDYLYLWKQFPCKTVFLYGNHDKQRDYDRFAEVFDEVHFYPFYLSDRIIVSHHPQNVWPTQINIHGHLHGSIIDKINYVCCSADTRHYNPVSSFKLQKVFQQLPKHTYRFLQEPWRADEKILKRPQNDMVLYPNGHTNVEATIELLGDKYKK